MPLKRHHLDRKAVYSGHIDYFLSAEQTGTGSPQDVPHGLGVTPTVVFFFITGDSRASWAAISIVEGVHDETNLKVTVTADILFRAFAIV